MPSHASSLAIPTTASGVITTVVDGVAMPVKILFGWALAETTGSAGVKLRLRDGTTASAPSIIPITMSGGESTRDFFGDEAIEINSGSIYLEIVTGSIEGSILWG